MHSLILSNGDNLIFQNCLIFFFYFNIIISFFVIDMQLQKFYSFINNVNNLYTHRKLSNIKENFNSTENIETLIKQYEFIDNLNYIQYSGKWNNLFIKKPFLNEKEGKVKINFKKVNNSLINSNKINVEIILKDGNYIDRYIKIDLSLNFSNNFIEKIKEHSKINFIGENITMKYSYHIFLVKFENYYIKGWNNVNITFNPKSKIINENLEEIFISKYSELNINILSQNISVDIKGQLEDKKEIQKKTKIYSFFSSIIGIFDLIVSIYFYIRLNDNNQIANSLSLITIVISLIYLNITLESTIVFIIHSKDKIILNELSSSVCINLLIFICKLRILFKSYKIQHINLFYNNRRIFKQKLMCFSISLNFFTFFSNILVGFVINNNYISFVTFSSTWIFQIIFSIKNRKKPPFSNYYIIISTISTLFRVIYFKSYKNNIFSLKPNYIIVFLIVLIVIFEALILIIQQTFGSHSIIPKYFKKLPYNYYTDNYNNDEKTIRNKICPICLENLSDIIEDFENNIIDNSDENKSIICYSTIILYFKNMIYKIFNDKIERKNYMITPCNHIYHSRCLEEWMKIKCICPYCKSKIPELE